MAAVKGHGPTRGHFKGALNGGRIWWVAPSYPQIEASQIWTLLKRSCESCWVRKSEQDRCIEFPSGGSIEVKSADSDVRGAGLDGIVMDEAAFTEQEVWQRKLRPMLADRRGWCMMLTTPNGQNWFYELFQNAASDQGWETWQRPSIDNPLMSREEMERLKREIGLWAFSQEHEAQFLSTEGAEFPGDYFPESMWFDEWPAENQIRWRIMSLDPSKGKSEKSDYSAIVMLALDHDGALWVDADIERRPITRIIDDGLRLAKEFRPHAFGVEANGFQETLGDSYAERSKAEGMMLPIHLLSNMTNKRVRIRAGLTPYLSRRELRFKRGSRGAKLLVEQLRAFPLDKHDDGPDALEMAITLCRKVFEEGVAA